MATDASNIGVGAALYQDEESSAFKYFSKQRKFIGFFSKSLNPAERRYTTNKKELLAMVKSLAHFKFYLLGTPFTLITDHASLRHMHDQKHLSPALMNWFDMVFVEKRQGFVY
jgi:putative transposase